MIESQLIILENNRQIITLCRIRMAVTYQKNLLRLMEFNEWILLSAFYNNFINSSSVLRLFYDNEIKDLILYTMHMRLRQYCIS